MFRTQVNRLVALPVAFSALLMMAGCQPVTPVEPAPTATAVVEEADATPAPSASAPQASRPLAVSSVISSTPISLAIPALEVEIPVTPMGWESVEVNGERTTRWVVPEDAAGWALNSAGAGAVGNLVLAGYQARGSAVFAPLALDEVEVGQEIIVTDAAGAQFTYRVVEVSTPVVLVGATEADRAAAAAYIAPTEDARLTMVTGWPAEITTHRIFAVAELVAGAE